MVKAVHFKDVWTVFQLDEASVIFIFSSKENFSDLLSVADPTLLRTTLPTNTNAWMSAGEAFRTRSIATRTVTRLMAQLGTSMMWTSPLAWLSTRFARTSTFARTLAVMTSILASLTARRTVPGTRFAALMTANEGPTTVELAGNVQPALHAISALARTWMFAIQQIITWLRAVNRLFLLVTPYTSRVSTAQFLPHFH